MSEPAWPVAWLRLRLFVAGLGPVACIALLLCVAGASALWWLLAQRGPGGTRPPVAFAVPAMPASHPMPSPDAVANENLALFYGSLGERRSAEQQVKALFELAGKAGLVLRQGEYKADYDNNAKVWTYQLVLPLTGSYSAIWRFAFLAMRALPFASLDDISFKRNAIGDANVEARLRLTLFLTEHEEAFQ